MSDETEDASMTPLSIGNADEETTTAPLDERVVDYVSTCPDKQAVTAAGLAAHLGAVSVSDANAELCGLLAAVGGGHDGASFRFENVENTAVMVFSFPDDFVQRARRKRQRQDFGQVVREIGVLAFRILKVVTAFGLILSLLILCVAAILGLVALVVAASSNNHRGGHQHRVLLIGHIRSLVFTIREMLWLYILTTSVTDGHDPVLRDTAYDISLVLSCCCGNPASMFYWFRASQLYRRRRNRGWRWVNGYNLRQESDIPGVQLMRRGSWRQNERPTTRSTSNEENSLSILSIAIEFLFGPSPTDQEQQRQAFLWKLRGAVILQQLDEHGGVPLASLAPYVDRPPPASFDISASRSALLEQGLMIASHYNGVPKMNDGVSAEDSADPLKAHFIFPELEAEHSLSFDLHRYDDKEDDGTWENFLCSTSTNRLSTPNHEVPSSYTEQRHGFTTLSKRQLSVALILGLLNFIGVIWFRQSLGRGGPLELDKKSTLGVLLLGYVVPVLRAYSILFLLLPASRLVVLLLLNQRLQVRNARRRLFAQLVAQK